MAMREVDVGDIATAIDETQKEIFGEAFDQEEVVLDASGDRTHEQMGEGLEGQHEVDDGTTESETEQEDDEDSDSTDDGNGEEKAVDSDDTGKEKSAQEKSEPEKEGRVPPGRLREQTERAKAAETERDALKAQIETERNNSRKELDTLRTQLAELTTLARQPPKAADKEPAKAEAEPIPDPLDDPKGFLKHVDRSMGDKLAPVLNAIETMRVNNSMNIARGVHGETFTKAYEAMTRLNPQNPDDLKLGRSIMASPDPGEAMVRWFKQGEVLREVGDDPAKYRERIAKEAREALMKDPEFRKALIADLQAEAQGADNGRPRTAFRVPKSLNGVNGGNARDIDPSQFDDADTAVFDSAFR